MEAVQNNKSNSRIKPKRLNLNEPVVKTAPLALFDNLPELITPKMVCQVLPYERTTIYDWHYRPEKYGVPENLFVKKRNPKDKTLLRRDVLKSWICA